MALVLLTPLTFLLLTFSACKRIFIFSVGSGFTFFGGY